MVIFLEEVLVGKFTKKFLDRTFGTLLRGLLRYGVFHPLLCLLYKIEIEGESDAASCTNGAIVVPNHTSFLDGPFLMSIAWPLARIRFVVWHAEYSQWFQWPLMKLFGAISGGSPKALPQEERARRKAKTLEIMGKVLKANRALGIFPEGGIGDGSHVEIKPHLSGLYDLIEDNPDKPVLLVRVDGLQYSRSGKSYPKVSFWKKLPVRVTIRRFDRVSLEGGPAGLNKRVSDYFNHRIPLPTLPPCSIVYTDDAQGNRASR